MIDGARLAPASGGKAKSLVVLIHGYGADGNDLIGLGRDWARALPDTAFVSPHAPAPCAQSPRGREWFPLTMRDPHEYARGVEHARPALDAFLDRELANLGLDDSRLVLVGFSQGTMMALHCGPKRAGTIAGILGYSGLLADPASLAAGETRRPPVLLVHGDQDGVIPVAALFGAVQGLAAAEIPVEWHVSEGAPHGIAPDGVALGGAFLRRVMYPPRASS